MDLKEIEKFAVAYTASPEQMPISSADFSSDGLNLVYNTSEYIKIISLSENGVTNSFTCKTEHFGAGQCKFFNSKHLVHTSTKENFHIRYLDLQKNHYLRYLAGHGKEVVSLKVASTFIVSGSKDESIRFWDPRSQKHQQMMPFPSTPLVAIHPSEEMIAVAYNSNTIETYEVKHISSDFLLRGRFEKVNGVDWTNIEFSPEGKLLIVTTNSNWILILNAITLEETHKLQDFQNPNKQSFGGSFSSDSRFVFGGSNDGLIHVWDINSPFPEFYLGCDESERSPVDPCNLVLCNPKHQNLATVSSCTVRLWNTS